jgi:hypothetical protein
MMVVRLASIAVPFVLGVLSGVTQAQSILDPARVRRFLAMLDAGPDDRPLQCDVTPLKPVLNYSFRFQAGYAVRVPMSQYQGSGHALAVLIRVTPDIDREGDSAQPTYLGNHFTLPNVPKTRMEAEFGGAYLLGEGGYAMKWMITDDAGRVCRKSWHVDVRRTRGEREVKVAMPRDTVWALSMRGAPDGKLPGSLEARPETDDAPPLRLTVLMHAAPMFPRRTRMRPNDTMTLLSSLSSLLERVPARSVRLVVFNLDQQKELYRKDGFTLDLLDQVSSSINSLELDLVDVETLQNRQGHVDLIAAMVNQETRATEPSDVVVFLGPMARYEDKVPRQSLEKAPGPLPRFFYFQVRPFFRGGRGGPLQSTLPDSINSAISRLNGKVVVIHTPGDFAKAITRLER